MKSKLLPLVLALAAIACSPKESAAQSPEAPQPDASPAKEQAASEKTATATDQVKLVTSHGDIVIQLDRAKAPVTVENFISYVKSGHYDGTVFHRVIDGFMIQGGGFASKDGKTVEKKSGKPIANEGKNGLKNLRGTIAMARTGDPDSATAQFFINVKDNGGLDYPNPDGHGYAVFGKVIEGMDVVDKIKAVATTTSPLTMIHPVTGAEMTQPSPDVPSEPVVIKSAALVTQS